MKNEKQIVKKKHGREKKQELKITIVMAMEYKVYISVNV